MGREFKLPDLGEGIHEAEIGEVLVQVGQEVEEGQNILVVETYKAAVEIPSPYTGTVQEIQVKPGDLVHVGDVLIVFGNGLEETAGVPAEAAATPLPPAQEAPAAPAEPPAPPPRGGPVPAAPSTRRLARELGVDLGQVPPSGPTGLVTAEDVRAFAAGSPPAAAPAPPPSPAAEPASPTVPTAAVRPSEIVVPPLPSFARWGPVERAPLRSVRRATAKHMALSWSQIPHVNHQDVVDITELEAVRQKHKAEVAAQGGRLTTTIFVMKAIVAALKAFPRFNASLDPEAEEIILKQYYHLGLAVDTDRGLLVPVVRDVDRKSIRDLAVEVYELAQRTRAGEVSLEEMQGGTFTITNIGALGGTGFAPIINYPEAAILGTGRARLQPVVRETEAGPEIVPRLLMPLVLAFDHRINDGADAARFTRVVIEALEDPERMLLVI